MPAWQSAGHVEIQETRPQQARTKRHQKSGGTQSGDRYHRRVGSCTGHPGRGWFLPCASSRFEIARSRELAAHAMRLISDQPDLDRPAQHRSAQRIQSVWKRVMPWSPPRKCSHATTRTITAATRDPCRRVVIGPDGKILASAGTDGGVFSCNPKSGAPDKRSDPRWLVSCRWHYSFSVCPGW